MMGRGESMIFEEEMAVADGRKYGVIKYIVINE
jgi:hypothetical protein